MNDEQSVSIIKKAVNEVLDERDAIDHETHKAHHEAVERWIVRQDRKDELFTKAINSAVGVIILGMFSGLAWIGKIVLEHLHISVA